jgi:hypothetical protein
VGSHLVGANAKFNIRKVLRLESETWEMYNREMRRPCYDFLDLLDTYKALKKVY